MFLRQVRTNQQQQTSNFRLRKPKRTRAKSPNISSHVSSSGHALLSGTTSTFTNTNINSQIHEENKTPLQPEDTPTNESDNLYGILDDNDNFFNVPNDSDDFYNIPGDDQETNREFNKKVYDGSNKQNHYSRNEAGPYFPNYTTLLLFL
jgi:hypothetical protein